MFSSCKKDDPVYEFLPGSEIDASEYSMGGTLVLLYSTDGGTTYSATVPASLETGSELMVKVNNGTTDLDSDLFYFDWSGSSFTPLDSEAAIAEFNIRTNGIVKVKVSDINIILAGDRLGQFYSIDPAGTLTNAFKITYESSDLTAARAFVYHRNNNKFYVSQDSNEGGDLYEVDPITLLATEINGNNGDNGAAVWDAIVNWAVAANDSLVAIGDFNADGNGIVMFGTDGGRSTQTTIANHIYGGLGMLYDMEDEMITVANSPQDGEINLDYLAADGVLTDYLTITVLENFPTDVSGDWLPTKAMVTDDMGDLYAIMFNANTYESYFISIDLENESASYIETLSVSNADKFNVLASIPKHFL